MTACSAVFSLPGSSGLQYSRRLQTQGPGPNLHGYPGCLRGSVTPPLQEHHCRRRPPVPPHRTLQPGGGRSFSAFRGLPLFVPAFCNRHMTLERNRSQKSRPASGSPFLYLEIIQFISWKLHVISKQYSQNNIFKTVITPQYPFMS